MQFLLLHEGEVRLSAWKNWEKWYMRKKEGTVFLYALKMSVVKRGVNRGVTIFLHERRVGRCSIG